MSSQENQETKSESKLFYTLIYKLGIAPSEAVELNPFQTKILIDQYNEEIKEQNKETEKQNRKNKKKG